MPHSAVRPLLDRAILEIRAPERGESTLVLADLHLGLTSLESPGSRTAEADAEALAAGVVETARRQRSVGLVIAGDVKHPIVGTPRTLRPVIFDFFSTLLSAGLSVEVVLGNHDVGLVPHLPKEVRVHPAGGLVRDGVGIFHGHRWPSNRVMAADRLVAGHLHPGVRLAPTDDSAIAKSRCWVRVEYPPFEPPPKRRRKHAPMRARELIVLPAYNPMCGAEALNRERPTRGRSFLFRRFLLKGVPRAYLLDGTDLGRIVTPRSTAHR
jgi:metallophosphoesterase superfamily enzyme